MNKNLHKIISLTTVAASLFLGLTAIGVGDGWAADCKALGEAISKERTLLTKKSMIEEAMVACPRDAEIVYQHGYTLERLRKYEEALISYKKAINIDANYAKAFFSIGDIQMILKNYQEAAEAYETGLRFDSGDARAQASLKDAQVRYKELTGKTLPSESSAVSTAAVKPAAPAAVAAVPASVRAPSKTVVAAEIEDSAPAQLVAPILRLQVPFENQTADLSQEAKDVLAVVVGQAMQRKDMVFSRFEVSGHTDNLGDQAKNLEISKQRAEAVKKYLTENFAIDGRRLQVAYYGQERPRVPNTSADNQGLNRRVEFSKIK
jgi:outer membrane protein OmpA-like peptidoglycan-associated protein